MQFNKYTHKHIHAYTQEDQCEWHRMARMTGPDCAVMYNLTNTHTHTHTHHNDLVRLRTAVSSRTGAYDFFSFEPLGGFDTPIAQTEGPVERKACITLSTRSVNFQDRGEFFGSIHNYGKQRCAPESTLGAF